MPARTQELKIAIGFKKQAGTGLAATTPTQLQTALAAADLWNLNLTAFNAPFPQFTQEDDGAFFGKGSEWVSQIFPTSLDAQWEWPAFLTSQNFAQVIAFAFGTVTPTTPAAGAYQYVATPQDSVANGVNLPATTVVAGIRAGTAGEIIDTALVGMVCAGFTLRIQRGPGLQNTSLTSQWVGSGAYVNNSGIAIPARYAEKRLGAGSASALVINGTNYLTNARFVDLEYTFSNNLSLESGFFPGSGSVAGYDVRGRMRFGRRTHSLRCTVELESTSTELAQLLAGTIGASQIAITGPLITGAVYHKAQLDFPQTRHKGYSLQEADGFTVAQVESDLLDATLGPVIATAITDKALIGT